MESLRACWACWGTAHGSTTSLRYAHKATPPAPPLLCLSCAPNQVLPHASVHVFPMPPTKSCPMPPTKFCPMPPFMSPPCPRPYLAPCLPSCLPHAVPTTFPLPPLFPHASPMPPHASMPPPCLCHVSPMPFKLSNLGGYARTVHASACQALLPALLLSSWCWIWQVSCSLCRGCMAQPPVY